VAAAQQQATSAALAAAAAIRTDVMRIACDGEFLGSEDELIERYNVSRPTLRQAVRIVEHEQLITVRRGVNGGFFTRLPTSEAVARVASVFLRLNGTDLLDLLRTVSVLTPALAEMACAAPPADRSAFRTWVDEQFTEVVTLRRRVFVERIGEFSRRLGELADCPPLLLFEEVVTQLTLAETKVNIFSDRSRMAAVADTYRQIAAAIDRGNANTAARSARQSTASRTAWVTEAVPTTRAQRKP
jgi:GntR family transcriptional regulator, transcriptional repressor for pyruvate dehydrogenase complex